MSTTRVISALLDGMVVGAAAVGAKEIIYRAIELGIEECVKEPLPQLAMNGIIGSLFFVGAGLYVYRNGIGFFSSLTSQEMNRLIINENEHASYRCN